MSDEIEIQTIITAVVITVLIIVTILTVHNIMDHASQTPNVSVITNALLPSGFNDVMTIAQNSGGSFSLFNF